MFRARRYYRAMRLSKSGRMRCDSRSESYDEAAERVAELQAAGVFAWLSYTERWS